MHHLILLCIKQYTKFEVPDFTYCQDMIGAKLKKTGHVTLTMPPFGVVCPRRLGFDTVYLRAKFDDFSFSRSGDMIGAHQNLNDSRALTTPLTWIICHPWAGTFYDQQIYQI